MRSDVVWVVIAAAAYAAVAPLMLNWLNRHGYIDLNWPGPERTDNDGIGGPPGTRTPAGGDEERREP